MTRDDPHGTELPNNTAALDFALRTVRKLKQGGIYEEPGILLIVRNEAGEQIFAIPF
jgi:hypothetical protein